MNNAAIQDRCRGTQSGHVQFSSNEMAHEATTVSRVVPVILEDLSLYMSATRRASSLPGPIMVCLGIEAVSCKSWLVPLYESCCS